MDFKLVIELLETKLKELNQQLGDEEIEANERVTLIALRDEIVVAIEVILDAVGTVTSIPYTLDEEDIERFEQSIKRAKSFEIKA